MELTPEHIGYIYSQFFLKTYIETMVSDMVWHKTRSNIFMPLNDQSILLDDWLI